MYRDKTIAVVVPCYNEETQIEGVINTMPRLVDTLIIVDDLSKDDTVGVIERCIKENNDREIVLIRHEVNQGVGGAIASGL